LRHASFAQWSNQSSVIHQLDARVKLVLLITFVVSVALLREHSQVQLAICFTFLLGVAWAARLPFFRVLSVSLLVLPVIGVFALIVYLSGDHARAWTILARSYLSGFSVIVAVSTTPLPQLLSAARFFRIPRMLVEVAGLIYRYLFVITGEAQQMQIAFGARAGRPGLRAIKASSGMIAVLFSRSYEKAAMVHNAMCARGFAGELTRMEFASLRTIDLALITGGLALELALHFA